LGDILQAILAPSNGDDSGDNDGNDTDGSVIPTVTLSVTNPTPQLNEEVILRCSLVGNVDGLVTFDFQPDDPRLVVNQTAGTGSFVIQEIDIGGAGFAFTCTATTNAGTSLPSNQVVIIPTGLESPPPP
jgi:hypothetical protein